MQSIVSRRKILIASLGAAAVGLTRTAQAAPANVPSIWDGKKMYETFKAQGAGFSLETVPASASRTNPTLLSPLSLSIHSARTACVCLPVLSPCSMMLM